VNQQSNSYPRSLWKRYRSLIVTTALAPTLIASGAAQAAATGPAAKTVSISPSAALALPSCNAGTLCTFQNSGYGGTRWDFAYNSRPHNAWFYVGSAANDRISSLYSHRAWTSWLGKDCPVQFGWDYILPGGSSLSNLANDFWDRVGTVSMNASISAVALMSSSGNTYPNKGGC